MGRRIQRAEPFVEDIVEALKDYGGAAHRSLVVERIAVARSRRGASLPSSSAIQREFERHLGDLFRLPFGEGSHRWALAGATDQAQERAGQGQTPGVSVPFCGHAIERP